MCTKKDPGPPPPAPSPICETFNIHHRKKKFNQKYVELYFSMGIVHVIISFL